jgi:hypothetical protein
MRVEINYPHKLARASATRNYAWTFELLKYSNTEHAEIVLDALSNAFIKKCNIAQKRDSLDDTLQSIIKLAYSDICHEFELRQIDASNVVDDYFFTIAFAKVNHLGEIDILTAGPSLVTINREMHIFDTRYQDTARRLVNCELDIDDVVAELKKLSNSPEVGEFAVGVFDQFDTKLHSFEFNERNDEVQLFSFANIIDEQDIKGGHVGYVRIIPY